MSASEPEKLVEPARVARRDLLKLPVMAAACELLPGWSLAQRRKTHGADGRG